MSFYSPEELQQIGLKSYGDNVLISRKASLYAVDRIEVGNNVRIDDFCILSAGGGIKIQNYVHIGAFSAIFGGSGVEIEDYSGLSPRCTLLSESDDFSGESMIHPFFPLSLKPNYKKGLIRLQRFAQLGAGTTVLPGCHIGEGAVTGAHSLVTTDLEPWWMHWGIPARKGKERSRNVVKLAQSHS